MSTGVWREPSFRLFLASRSVATAGYAITAVALPLLVFQLTDSALLTASVAALEVVPYLVFGLVAGALADRVDRKKLMLCCQATAAVSLASIPAAQALGMLTAARVLVAAVVLHTAFVWFDAASFGALPTLVGRDRLVAANSAVFTSASVIDVSFPAVGGLLIAAVGPAYALGADALAYVVAGTLIAMIRVPLHEDRKPDPDGPKMLRRTVIDIRAGLRYLWAAGGAGAVAIRIRPVVDRRRGDRVAGGLRRRRAGIGR